MTHQITLTLSDDEYAAIAKEAAASGQSVEALLHDAVSGRFASRRPAPAPPAQPIGDDEVEEYLYRIGFTSNLPTHEPDTPEDEAEAEQLAELFGHGKPVSDMIIEDRGPY